MTSICIFGAGAIGGLLAARLELVGVKTAIVARGAHRAAIEARGLILRDASGEHVTHPLVGEAANLGVQDYVLITLKAQGIEAALPQLAPLIGPQTAIVAAVNGIPWWYCYGLPAPLADRRITAIDPQGAVWAALPPSQVLGCVVYPAAEIIEPGVVAHSYGDRFVLGEPDGTRSERVERLATLLVAAGLKAPVRPRIRDDIWVKLWGNMAFNPISALTKATLDVITGDPGTRDVAAAMMAEGQQVAERLGVRFAIGIEQRIAGAAEVGAHKTSMLQDLERGRPIEIEAVLGAVVEMAEWVDVPMPISRAVLALTRQRAAMSG